MKTLSLFKKKELRVIGIMNGTSLDGIDYVLISIKRKGKAFAVKYLSHGSTEFTPHLQTELRRAVLHELNVKELAFVHHELGQKYADDLRALKKQKKWKFDLVGVHGQTVFHSGAVATLQIGEPSYLSNVLNVPVVSDFRVADLALGGQGAPVASLFHRVVFASQFKGKAIALHNIGGISNVTLMNAKGDVEQAFDTGPGNMLMDLAVQDATEGVMKYDVGGEWAKRGVPAEKIIDQLLEEIFFSKKPPKSCGREEFGAHFLTKNAALLKGLSDHDRLATLTEFTARSMAIAYTKFAKKMPAAVILCGGGAKNEFLKQRLQYHLPKTKVISTLELGWPLQSIEGAAFALLAAFRVWGVPNNLPKTTGAKRPVLMGKISEV